MEIDLVPLKLFSQRIAEGWTMVPGYPLQPGDFAVTMSPPGWPVPRSNLSRAASTRNHNAAVLRSNQRMSV